MARRDFRSHLVRSIFLTAPVNTEPSGQPSELQYARSCPGLLAARYVQSISGWDPTRITIPRKNSRPQGSLWKATEGGPALRRIEVVLDIRIPHWICPRRPVFDPVSVYRTCGHRPPTAIREFVYDLTIVPRGPIVGENVRES